jgi:hypothetical protein
MPHTTMDTSLATVADDLWPKIVTVTSHRPPGGRVTLEIPGLSEGPLLTTLARAIHDDMRAAGKWAARISEPRDKSQLSAKDFFRVRVENAARLLAIYAALYGSANYISIFDLSPEALKASASRSYATALHDAQAPCPAEDQPLFLPPLSTISRN